MSARPFTPGLRRRTRLLAVLFSLSALASAILANLIAYRYPHRHDLSQGGRWTLSPRTTAALKQLDTPVKITTFFDPASKQRPGEGALVSQLARRTRERLTLFGEHTRLLEIHHLDYHQDPIAVRAHAARFEGRNIEDSVIVEAGERNQLIRPWQLATFDYSRNRVSEWHLQSRLISAILSVTSQTRRRIGAIRGHRELSGRPLRVVREMLETENVELTEVQLTQPVPEGIDLLLLAVPRGDLDRAEAGQLERYLAGGGRLLAVIPPGPALPQLGGVLARFGVAIDENVVLLNGVPDFTTDRLRRGHPITDQIPAGAPLKWPFSRSLRAPATLPASVTHTPLLQSGQGDMWRDMAIVDGKPRRDTVQARAPYTLAVACSWTVATGDQRREGRLVVFGSDAVLEPTLLERRGLGNRSLLHHSLSWPLDRQMLAAAAPVAAGQLHLSTRQSYMLGVAIVVITPMFTFFIGVFVWLFRKD